MVIFMAAVLGPLVFALLVWRRLVVRDSCWNGSEMFDPHEPFG